MDVDQIITEDISRLMDKHLLNSINKNGDIFSSRSLEDTPPASACYVDGSNWEWNQSVTQHGTGRPFNPRTVPAPPSHVPHTLSLPNGNPIIRQNSQWQTVGTSDSRIDELEEKLTNMTEFLIALLQNKDEEDITEAFDKIRPQIADYIEQCTKEQLLKTIK